MPASLFDSSCNAGLFGDTELAALFADSAVLRAMLVVEGALARAQADLGLIPQAAAQAIHRDAMELVIDPALLAGPTGKSAVPVPGLVEEFRRLMAQDDAAQYVHFGATSQDIVDTAQALRLRRVLDILEARGRALVADLGRIAQLHAAAPMPAHTYGVPATPTSLGAVAASWGQPILSHLDRLTALRADLCRVSLSGAAGTNAAMGPQAGAVRAKLATSLNLHDPEHGWHSARDGIAGFGAWLASMAGLCAKAAEDIVAMIRAGTARLEGAGGSSTMPQKQNPVAPMAVQALARHATAQASALHAALPHRDQRDGAAWMTEWLALPQAVFACGRALALMRQTVGDFRPQTAAMLAAIDDGSGLIYAEALQFHMARHMPRPAAQAEVKALCEQVRATGGSLQAAARAHWPEADFADLFTPAAQLGSAPNDARAFAARAAAQALKDTQ